MASPRELLTAALDGGTPETTPLSMYSWMMNRPSVAEKTDDWARLFEMGLGLCHHCQTVRHTEHGTETKSWTERKGDDTYTITTKTCPEGELRMVKRNGWHHEDWIKTPQDYKIRQWMIEHTELETDYDAFYEADQWVGPRGVPVVCGSRTPLMSINIDWAGTEQFCMDLALEVPELLELYEAQKKLFVEETKLIAAGPGRFVKWFENLTLNMIGPARYDRYLLNVYDQCVPMLADADKRVMVHYDGELSAIAESIARGPFHMIESLSEPPEGDMTYDRCREAWPDKVFWANINVGLYSRPAEELRDEVQAKRRRAGKRALAFEISEDLPNNWDTSIPVVLEALDDLG